MRTFFALLFCLLLCNSSICQEEVKDLILKSKSTYSENPGLSFEYLVQAEELLKTQENKELQAEVDLGKSRFYLLTTQFDKCNEELSKVITYYSATNNLKMLRIAYSYKSNMLAKIGDLEASHLMLLEILKLERELKDTLSFIGTISNLTLDYIDGDLDSMKMYLDELTSLESYFDKNRYYYYYQNYGSYSIAIKDYAKAISYYFKALSIAEELKMTDSKATCLMLLARAYRKSGNYKAAEDFGAQSLNYSREMDLIFEESEALEELVKVKELQQDWAGAYLMVKNLNRVESEIYDLQKIQKVKQIEGKLKLAEKEKEIAQGKAQIELEKREKFETKSKFYWMTALAVFVCVLLLFTFYIYWKTKGLNQTIRNQKREVELKSLNLEEALSNIEDSLEYSKLIQSAMLPKVETIKSKFEDAFIFYKPKDIVSGDFYWFHEVENELILAVGDCTGHGVPGAMVSMVCHEALNKVVKEYGIRQPDLILNEVRDIVVHTFHKNENLNDGMDVALISIKETDGKKLVQFAGAHNPLWLFRYGGISPEVKSESILLDKSIEGAQIIELKADKQPIGRFDYASPFKVQEIELQKGDLLYLFSDGFADQFGGPKGKKIKSRNLRKLLHGLRDLNMQEQRKELEFFLHKWMVWESENGEKSSFEQIDDICVLGLKV